MLVQFDSETVQHAMSTALHQKLLLNFINARRKFLMDHSRKTFMIQTATHAAATAFLMTIKKFVLLFKIFSTT